MSGWPDQHHEKPSFKPRKNHPAVARVDATSFPNGIPFYPVSSILSFVFRLRLGHPGSKVPVRFCRLCWHSLLFIDRDLRIPRFMEDYTSWLRSTGFSRVSETPRMAVRRSVALGARTTEFRTEVCLGGHRNWPIPLGRHWSYTTYGVHYMLLRAGFLRLDLPTRVLLQVQQLS